MGRPTMASLVVTMLFSLVFMDGPMMIIKKLGSCSGKAILFKMLVPPYGWLFGTMGIQLAYQESIIVVAGHHPLVTGLASFVLSTAGTVLIKYARGRACNMQVRVCCVTILGERPSDYTVRDAWEEVLFAPVPDLASEEVSPASAGLLGE